MTDAAFLAAVLADPESDTPRLVYADWLDEHGDDAGRARAELIRAQCELERSPRPARRKELTATVKRVLKAHQAGWLKPLRDAGFGMQVQFRRGLPEWFELSAVTFTREGGRVLAALPTLRAARFPQASGDLRAGLNASPHLARLAEVDLADMCSCGRCPIVDELRGLFVSPHAAGLTALTLTNNRLDTAAARVLIGSPRMARLRSLGLAGNRIGPTAGRELARSPLAAGLAVLDLSRNRVGDAGGRAFVTADRAGGWERLDLRHNGIGPEVAERLRARFGDAVKV